MPENLRALVVILAIGVVVFALARRPIVAIIGSDDAFNRDRNLWLAITLIVFLAHNFWLYMIVAGIMLVRATRTHDNPLAMYCIVLLAAPTMTRLIPGLGPIDHIFAINHYRLVNLCVLLPMFFRLRASRLERNPGPRSIDICVGGLVTWMFLAEFATGDPVRVLRTGFYLFIDIALPYYVASRSLNDLRDFRRVAAAMVVICAVVGLIAVFEAAKHWLLYTSLRPVLDIPPSPVRIVLERGAGGLLRAMGTLNHPIVLGFTMTISIAMAYFLLPAIQPTWKRRVAVGALLAGLIAALSRGPWVGCAAMLLTAAALGPNVGRRLAWSAFTIGGLATVLLISPFGDTIIAYLPFVGSVEAENVDYRTRLIDTSFIVFMQNPVFGDLNYMANPILEEMRQGQGIIDIVNSYIQVALPYGLLGLVLYAGAFLAALLRVNAIRRRSSGDAEVERLGRVLMAVIVGMLVTIATTSSIGAITVFLWIFTGVAASYVRVFGIAAVEHKRINSSRGITRRQVGANPAAGIRSPQYKSQVRT